MNIIGIRREEEFSPNMVDLDTAIIEAVANELVIRGHSVRLVPSFSEAKDCAEALGGVENVDALFSMNRDEATLQEICSNSVWNKLLQVNTARGILSCSNRIALDKVAREVDVATPRSIVIDTTGEVDTSLIVYPCWMKNIGHTIVKEDVVLVHDDVEAHEALESFRSRNVQVVQCSEHVEGDLIKFYGVVGVDFFNWAYPAPLYSKFGLEAANGPEQGYQFNAAALQRDCFRLAKALGVPAFGGDCIVQSDGKLVIIDFNDWPSFRRCRKEAGEAIASLVESLGLRV